MTEQPERTTIRNDPAPLHSKWKHKRRERIVEVLNHSKDHDDYQVKHLASGRVSWIFGAYLRRDYEPYLDANIARVDSITATYFRKGSCTKCGGSGVERTKTFTGLTLEACNLQAESWGGEPLLHKRCE